MKKIFLLLLALPMLAAAQEPLVQLPPCCEGNSYTVRIPVRFSDSTTVRYVWYRNDTAVTAEATLPSGEKAIAYTIPANKAHGNSVVFHFKYRLNDGYGAWTSSPKYALTFSVAPAQPSAITGSTTVCANTTGLTYSVTNVSGISYTWSVTGTGWGITAGQNTSSVTVTAGTANGSISVTPGTALCGSGTARTQAVTVNPTPTLTRSGGAASQTVCQNSAITNITYTRGGSATGFSSLSWSPSTPAGISVSGGSSGSTYTISGTPTAIGAYTYTISTTGQLSPCAAATVTGTITRGGISTVGTASISAVAACSGVTNVGTISVAPASSACTAGVNGVIGVGTISVAPAAACNGGVDVAGTISISAAN